MKEFNLQNENGMTDFLDLLWYYVNNSGNEEIVLHRIGAQTSTLIQSFLASFLESSEQNLREYALCYFGNSFQLPPN